MTKLRRPYGHTIYCDDIREEKSNKLTYVGVYNGTLFTPEFPIVIPKLCVATHFFQYPENDLKPLKVLIFGPGERKPIVDVDVPLDDRDLPDIDPESDTAVLGVSFTFILSNLKVKAEGLLKTRVMYGDEEIRIGALRIAQAPSVLD